MRAEVWKLGPEIAVGLLRDPIGVAGEEPFHETNLVRNE